MASKTDLMINKINMKRLVFASIRRFTTQDQRLPNIFKQMRETAQGIQDYNFREYFLRKINEVRTNKSRTLKNSARWVLKHKVSTKK